MAPRAYWKGYLKLSLVSCPVKLYSATTTANKISFNQLHKDTMNRVQMKYHDPELGEIERSDLVKGYQFEKDKYVVIEKEELESIQIESNKTIEIEGFVDASEIDNLYLDSPYFLGPDGPVAEETYGVIREALERTNKIGIARIVLSSRERIISLAPYGDGMVLTTLRSKNEVRDAAHYFDDVNFEPNDELMAMAEMIINQKVMEFDPDQFEDRYEAALMELVKAKIAGKEPVISKAPEQGKVVNLMDALKASLEEERAPAAASKPKAAAKAKPAAKTKRAPAKKKTA
ncbi:MAG: Ku protein [Pseudomonadota bacterium]